jgi:hypothetical protein
MHDIYHDSWYWVFRSRLRHLQSLSIEAAISLQTLRDLSTHCVHTLTSLHLIESPTSIYNAQHVEAILKCHQLIDLRIGVRATTETKDSEKWIWQVPSDNGWKSLPNLKRLTLFIHTEDSDYDNPLATLTIDDSWNHLESITLGGDWCLSEPLIHSKPFQSCQQLHILGDRDKDKEKKRKKGPPVGQLLSISLLLQCHAPLLTHLTVNCVNDKIIDVINNITTLTSLDISSFWSTKTCNRATSLADKKRFELLQLLFKHLPNLQHFTFTENQRNDFGSILDDLIPLMSSSRLTSINISITESLPSATKLLQLLESLPLLKLVQFDIRNYEPVEWTDMILLRAMVSVVASTPDGDWMKVDIVRMINAAHNNGHAPYIDWYPMRLMKEHLCIDFDPLLIPSPLSKVQCASRSRWSELNYELLGSIVEMIDHWKEWLGIAEVCTSWRDALSISSINNHSHHHISKLDASKRHNCGINTKASSIGGVNGSWKKLSTPFLWDYPLLFLPSYPYHRAWLPLLGPTRLQYVRSITLSVSQLFFTQKQFSTYCRYLPCLRELCIKWDHMYTFLDWYHNLQSFTSITSLDIHITEPSYSSEECIVLPLPPSVATLKLSINSDGPHQQPLLLHSSWGSRLLSLTLIGAWMPVWSIPTFNKTNNIINHDDSTVIDDKKSFIFPRLTHLTLMLNMPQSATLDLFNTDINHLPSLTYLCVNVSDAHINEFEAISSALHDVVRL